MRIRSKKFIDKMDRLIYVLVCTRGGVGWEEMPRINGESNMRCVFVERGRMFALADLRDALDVDDGRTAGSIARMGSQLLCVRTSLTSSLECIFRIMRCFTLYGSILCYHEEAKIEEVTDPSNPRARLNLLKIETIAEMHSKHKPGLPTEHLLTVNIYSNLGKRKWEMCCTSKEQQVIWYNAINAYDGKVTRGSGSQAVLRSPSEDNEDMDPYLQMPQIGSTERLELRPRLNSAGDFSMQEIELVAKTAAKAAVNMSLEKFREQQNELSHRNVVLLVVVLNTASYWIRYGSEQTYKITLFFLNAFALCFAFQKSSGSTKPKLSGPKAHAAKAKRHKVANPSLPSASPAKQKREIKLLQLGSTIPKDTMQPHSYGQVDPTMFNLRIGPNYKKNKQKAPSGPALYELYSMDFLYGDGPIKHTSDKFVIPNISSIIDSSTGHPHIPPMIIVNTWLPGEEPSLFAKNTEGETYSIPMVFVITKNTLEQLKDIKNASPAVKLWSEWCRKAESDPEFRGRFKCMGYIEDIESTE